MNMARTGYDFQPLTQENRDWKEARAMSKEIIQFDQAMFETKLDAMVRDKVEQIVNAMLDEEADLIANAAYYMHLDQPQDAYRMVITIRTSGGKGYIRANTTGDPTQGKQVAEFTFAEGGTTEVKFTKAVKTQDLLLWVPSDSLPQNQLYIEKVEVF